jgi:hypothetical protein
VKDFLGHEYGPGDLVIYGAMSGRSVNMVIGRVVEIYASYRSNDTYKMVRLKDGELPPFKSKHGWFDAEGNRLEQRPEDLSGCEWREYQTDEREETVTKVKIQPVRAARWTQHHGHDYYVDTRSGKRIDPWRGTKHIAGGGYEIDTRTGEPVPENNNQLAGRPGFVSWEHRKYVSVEFQPWVEKRNDGPKPVTIEITDNIVKWEGELPAEVP